jgi:Protein of unknown function (DUF3515)
VVTGGLLASLVMPISSCSSPVDVSPPEPGPTARDLCGALAEQLPDVVVDQEARDTAPDSDLTAAWGDPAIVLRCGVPEPEALQPTSELVTVDGVDWFPEQLTAGYLFTTYGRAVFVEVSVPDDYAPEAGALTDLADAVQAEVPRNLG